MEERQEISVLPKNTTQTLLVRDNVTCRRVSECVGLLCDGITTAIPLITLRLSLFIADCETEWQCDELLVDGGGGGGDAGTRHKAVVLCQYQKSRVTITIANDNNNNHKNTPNV